MYYTTLREGEILSVGGDRILFLRKDGRSWRFLIGGEDRGLSPGEFVSLPESDAQFALSQRIYPVSAVSPEVAVRAPRSVPIKKEEP